MDVQQAYNLWSAQYDTNKNRTRDLEGHALRTILAGINFSSCLEIGCGTGKNTQWLADHAQKVTAVDLSAEMLSHAKAKITDPRVRFIQADITQSWGFGQGAYDLVTFSLVLEHIEKLDDVFAQATGCLKKGGHLYVGELHPYKQYTGTKARFETEAGTQEVTCFSHHISDFVQAAKKWGLVLADLDEFFDEHNKSRTPRILTLLLKKV